MRILRFAIVILGVLSLGVPTVTAQPASPLFENATARVGIDAKAPDWGHIAVGDFNGDGWDDLLLNQHPPMTLFRNNRNGTFSAVPNPFPPVTPATAHRHILTWCDLDRDGDEDLIVGTGVIDQPDPLSTHDLWLRNNGGSFVDITAAMGTQDPGTNVYTTTCADLDMNGWPDVLHLTTPMEQLPFGMPISRLWMNYGTEFREESVARGLEAEGGDPGQPTMYAADCVDLNGDRWPDCIASGDNFAYWYVSRGAGQFVMANHRGIDPYFPELDSYMRDAVIADFTGDGRLDVLIVNSSGSGTKGEPHDILKLYCGGPSRLSDPCWKHVHIRVNHDEASTIAPGDFDNDGDIDFFLGMNGNNVVNNEGAKGPDFFFLNNGQGQFSEAAAQVGLMGPVGQRLEAGGAAVIDYDRDGRLDLVVGYTERGDGTTLGPFWVYRNVTQNGNAWVGFILRAPLTLGTVVEVRACSRRQVQQLSARAGWLSQDSRNVHFGLGSCREAPRVTLRWPDGTVSEGTVPANAYYTVPPLPNPPGPTPTPTPAPPTPAPPPPTPAPTPTRTPRGDRPPRVQIVSGVREVSIQKPAWIVALATDDEGIQSVAFDVDGVQLPPARSSVTPPYYAAMWDTRDRRWASGWHTITITVTDTAGQTARDSIRLFLRR